MHILSLNKKDQLFPKWKQFEKNNWTNFDVT